MQVILSKRKLTIASYRKSFLTCSKKKFSCFVVKMKINSDSFVHTT